MNLIGIAAHRLRNRPVLDDFIDDDCDEFDDVEEKLPFRNTDISGALTTWDFDAATPLPGTETFTTAATTENGGIDVQSES